ncbi:MAG TPA: hypothetical protein VM580_21895 [Labilithrix sp.]|jgi:hypothetical protein|nr:hypothetical protein [Labilithrix sp.]
MRHFILGVVGIVAAVIAACSSSDSETTKAKETHSTESNPSDASAAGVQDTNTSADATTPPPPPPEQITCSAKDGTDACYDCCEEKSPGGADVFDQAFRACICKPTTCGTQCAQSECADPPTDAVAGDLCSTCLDDQDECDQTATDTCSQNASCSAFLQCIEVSACDGEAELDEDT